MKCLQFIAITAYIQIEEAKYDDDAENIKGDDEYDENDATYLYVLYQTWQA